MSNKQSMDYDDLGDRMKMYEGQEAGRHFIPHLPIIARMDGRAFHMFARDLEKPYDSRMMESMRNVTTALVHETNAIVGYTQSDEITLVWAPPKNLEGFWFGGRVQKMCGMLAATATLEFYLQIEERLDPKFAKRKPRFDARVWQVPNETEATNVLVWRENDAVKNSIMAKALSCVGHRKVLGKNQKEQLDLIHEAGESWESQLAAFKRGSYVSRQRVSTPFTTEEFNALPERHHARTNPDLVVDRVVIKTLELPRITTVVNRNDVIFRGAEPVVATENAECSAG
jgi:tRNA(His) 5'-end guanylyltransferase